MLTILKIFTASIVIAYASWLSNKKPELAGFIIALPIASLIALAFSYMQHGDAQSSITFAKSILVGVPISYLFFMPFFFSERLGNNFWLIYLSGFALLVIGFFIHSAIMNYLK
jgi:hypothetical protein